VFNKGFNLMFVPRLLYAILREWSLFLSLDSVFIDSPLNEEGFEQAVKLQEFIANGSTKDSKVNVATNIASTLEVLRGEGTQTSVIVSSNLRRAISTTTGNSVVAVCQ
jgi:broad specificity phosphatase PhoE